MYPAHVDVQLPEAGASVEGVLILAELVVLCHVLLLLLSARQQTVVYVHQERADTRVKLLRDEQVDNPQVWHTEVAG